MKIKIENSEIEVLINAHKELNGVYEPSPVQQQDGSTVMQPRLVRRFQYKSTRVKFNISKNLRLLEAALKPVLEDLQSAIEACKPTPETLKLEGADYIKYDKLRSEILKKEIELDGLLQLKGSELEVDRNDITGETLAHLGEILLDDFDQAQAA